MSIMILVFVVLGGIGKYPRFDHCGDRIDIASGNAPRSE